MPSPFPGMNPYLEHPHYWQQFHNAYIQHLSEALVRLLRPRYVIRTGEHVFIHEPTAQERGMVGQPDVQVSKTPHQMRRTQANKSVSKLAPAYGWIPQDVVEERMTYVTIRDRESLKVVTVMELLSPSNKTGDDRGVFLRKRNRYFQAKVNYVEMDFLRAGTRLSVEGLPPCPYYILIKRLQEWPRVGLWPVQLRESLPSIPIPLRLPDEDVLVDLQAVLQHVYDTGGYEDFIYTQKVQAPIAPEDAAWAESLVPRAER